jgi:hypothetical protein
MGYTFAVREAVITTGDAGESNDVKREILIHQDLPPAVKVETFYHEVAHMMLALSGWDDYLGNEVDEGLAQFLGASIAQFLSVNESLPVIDKEEM